MEEIKEKIDKILKIYEDDENRLGGYSSIERLHISAPEDYVESRTDWETLQYHAEDMYYMLQEIKDIIKDIKRTIK
jgi:Txe/YoeB family toxin of Txe-Axe toxin-antitoxin module